MISFKHWCQISIIYQHLNSVTNIQNLCHDWLILIVKMQISIFLVDDIGSCERVSCECDMAFVSDLSRVYFHQDHSNGQIKNTGMIRKNFSSKVIHML